MEKEAGEPGPESPTELERLRRVLAETEEQLTRARRAERILEQITTAAKDFAIILLTPDGRVALWNQGAERLLGYDDREILGQSARILFTSEERAKGTPEEELERARSEGRAEDDTWLVRKDGSRFWASGVTAAIREGSGPLEGFVKILRDRSAQKNLEDELRRLNASLEERICDRTGDLEDALQEMAAFSYSIAHDLRAPLRAMAGFAQALAEDFRDALGEAGAEYTRRISEAARFMNQMIEDLLTYSRLTRSEILCHPIEPEAVLDEVLRHFAQEIRERNAQVVVDRPLPPALGHEVTLAQVFTNLLSNALKFVAPGAEPRIRISAEERPDAVRFYVEDNGIGVPAEYRERIFGIFERLHPVADYPGTGIGLAIVNRAMERMKGSVGVEPGAAGGSRFWIQLRRPAAV